MNRLCAHTFPEPGNHVGIISHAGGYEEECHLLFAEYSILRVDLHSRLGAHSSGLRVHPLKQPCHIAIPDQVAVSGAGNTKMTAVPRPSSLSSETVPPCNCMMDWTMARPRPVPDSCRKRALSAR